MSKTIRLRGIQVERSVLEPSLGESKTVVVTSKGRVRLGVSRDTGGLVSLPDIQPDQDIACVEYANGFKFWTRVDTLYEEQAVRSTRTASVGEADIFDPQLANGGTERGVAGLAIAAIEFFGIDIAGDIASDLCKRFEIKQLQPDGPGIYQCRALSATLTLERVPGDQIPPSAKPILLFIHGTGSSSAGGFGGLWDEAVQQLGAGQGINIRKDLQEKYAEACYFFEHRTLTVSPLDNALEIASGLPENAQVHLVTHSRGGLVGELLCLGQRDTNPDPLQTALIDAIFDSTVDRSQGELLGLGFRKPVEYDEQKSQLIKLRDMLDKKHIKVIRFVRVASPARGTTLASGRLDRWLSIINFLSSNNDLVEVLQAIAKARTDPRTLPGLEAMMPGSALVRLLNHAALKVTADLTVIAGDLEGDSIWGKLKGTLADWFYAGDHDLVVNTGSMYGGLVRVEGAARFFFDQGPVVNHFNYFKNAATVERLKAGLLRQETDQANFKPLAIAKQEAPARGVRLRANQDAAPLAIVLHGILASHLSRNNERIWLDYAALSKGKLAELGITVPGIVSAGMLDDYYGDFLDYLSNSHRVEAFHYDWRLSILDSAKQLALLVESRLPDCEAKRQPLRFVAHSMGGLVVRAMFQLYPVLWKKFQALPGSRLLMLGTPNFGSYEAIRWLTGWNPTLGQLSWLDITHDTQGLVTIVNRYPGLLELLPSNGKTDYADPKIWQQICKSTKSQWPLPLSSDLQKLPETWRVLRASPVDSERMLYVAGWSAETVGDFENISGRGLFSEDRPPLRFYATQKGDGTVPWDLGLLTGIKTWYVETSHDQLLNYSPAFPAYLDLIQSGTTSRLSQNEPASSRTASGVEALKVMRDIMPDSAPTATDTLHLSFGAERPTNRSKQRRLPQVKVSIRHGNLAYARHPIGVGHYFGDTIVSAEAELDSRLDGLLTKRILLGLYPGELHTHEIFLHQNKNAKPNGAIVIGLGRVGELSPGMLASGINQALLDYALKISEWPDDRFGAANTVRAGKISFLLIGSGFGGMSIRDSLTAILNGVKAANERLLETGFDDRVLFDEVEFLELYLDLAIKAAREMAAIFRDETLQTHFIWQDHTVQAGVGGLQRVLFDTDPNWWQRLEISYDNKHQLMRFIALTDLARAEVTLVAGQMQLADNFIAEMIAQTHYGRETAQTLFEMLIPNRLKELAPNQYDVVLILDETSARYPWELLDDHWSVNQKPLAVMAGMLRQFKTQNFRAKPLHTTLQTALVVGNPLIPLAARSTFPDLPGAAQEAGAVAEALASKGYEVNKPLGRKTTGLAAREILTGLHGEAYRILHFAGHGVHEFPLSQYSQVKSSCEVCGQNLPQDTQSVSGMVIGENVFLTPGDIQQMRWVPELVFINCCHLGRTDGSGVKSERYNALAANLGAEFINMGVKAVVAAGWAVDDAAAKAFAARFYQSLLDGEAFGLAVRAARLHVYEQFPEVNTWGAYQCYGDPDFRLVANGEQSKKVPPPYYARAEWVADLENLLSAVRSSKHTEDSDKQWQTCLDNCKQRVPPEQLKSWQAQADVAAALGTLYGEWGRYALAIEQLNKALVADNANFPVKALEQRANYVVKRAVQWHQSNDETIKRQAEAEISKAIENVISLMNLSSVDTAKTVERHSLLGSAYKRLAWLQSGKTKKKAALENMRLHYQAASDKGCSQNKFEAYPLCNWVTAEVLLEWFGQKADPDWRPVARERMGKAMDAAKERLVENPDYWNCVVEPDCLLMNALMNNVFTVEDCQRIANAYHLAADRGASHKDQTAIREQFEFLIYMAEQAKQTEVKQKLQEILVQLP